MPPFLFSLLCAHVQSEECSSPSETCCVSSPVLNSYCDGVDHVPERPIGNGSCRTLTRDNNAQQQGKTTLSSRHVFCKRHDMSEQCDDATCTSDGVPARHNYPPLRNHRQDTCRGGTRGFEKTNADASRWADLNTCRCSTRLMEELRPD